MNRLPQALQWLGIVGAGIGVGWVTHPGIGLAVASTATVAVGAVMERENTEGD